MPIKLLQQGNQKIKKRKVIMNLRGTTGNIHKYNTKKLVDVFDQSADSYDINEQIRFKTLMKKWDICGFFWWILCCKRNDDIHKYNKNPVSKNKAPFFFAFIKS